MDKPKLGTGSVPVRVAAMAYGKEASWIRAGIIAGWLPIGEATRNGVKITSIEQMNSKYGRISHRDGPADHVGAADETHQAGTLGDRV